MMPSAREFALIDRWQRDFPLQTRPYATVGRSIGLGEGDTIAAFGDLIAREIVTRIGAVVRPLTVGASTLAAAQVPPTRLEEVAARVSAEPLVSHNYEREHAFNLWFVIAGPRWDAVTATLARLRDATGLAILDLPLVEAYHLDLGFSLADAPKDRPLGVRPVTGRPTQDDRRLLAAIEDGLPLAPRPYHVAGRAVGLDEDEVIGRIRGLVAGGIISRFGCVVSHRALGYAANAMAVWDVPDDAVAEIAARMVRHPRVTLCYRRARRPPHWPYNLFCMVHAKWRANALDVITELNADAGGGGCEHAVLFPRRCYKQRGAVFSDRSAN